MMTLNTLADELGVGHPSMQAWFHRGHLRLGDDCVKSPGAGLAHQIGQETARRISKAVLLIKAGVSAPVAFRISQGDKLSAMKLRRAVSKAVSK